VADYIYPDGLSTRRRSPSMY